MSVPPLDDVAEQFVPGASARMQAVHDALKAAKAPRPRVAVIEWGDSICVAGHWVPEMVKRAGGIDVLGKPREGSLPVTPDVVRASDPQVILVGIRGYDLERSVLEAEQMLNSPEWAWARERRVFAIDAGTIAGKPGPQLVDAVEAMARVFNPDLFSPVDARVARELSPVTRPA